MASSMQVILEASSDSPIVIETSPKATIATLISSYCTIKDVAYNSGWMIIDDKERALPQFSTLASLGIVDGQILKISYKGQSFLSREKWPFMIALAALIICVAGILVISMIYGLTGGKYPDDYGVVMDAGSTKTNTLLYSWKSNKHKGTGLVTQATNCFAKGGIAEMDPMHLEPVINCAKSVTKRVDPSVRSKTPLFFAATAGMRLLNLTNPDRVDEILEQLNLNLTKTGLSVEAIEIISGKDEGIYGWIASNFLRKTLETPQNPDSWVPTTYGSLDMGGASMQITYALPKDEAENGTDVTELELYETTHYLFSFSNLCFGRQEAERRHRSLLVTDITKRNYTDPCSPFGYEYAVLGRELFERPCTKSKIFDAQIKEDPSILDKNFTFTGTSKPDSCKSAVSKLLDNDLCKEKGFKECFRRTHNISNKNKFLAFATYYFTTSFLNVTNTTLENFIKVAEDYCLKNESEVEKITEEDYGKEYCFNSQYIQEVLTTGFGFTPTTWKNIEFVGKIDGKDVGWSLGYMINATNIIPVKDKTPKLISATALAVCLVLFIMIVVGAIIFILRNRDRADYNSA
ncbi:ectonucleoside triphosphate diphosphohydrolase 8 isoform X2 [Parasteatoda tepidariorum]|uniref:ectonucleoside triphosphate diphosphohydrolase 8 isoform X2 n=1 Tax=Parasteatoda tepidariorum TaxID=114398 RepID=UPI001C71FA31|nr:ectonucleoside triphosphate diphosphohydrolase 8 isoform X1 [Parasteatoda tepidariorum]